MLLTVSDQGSGWWRIPTHHAHSTLRITHTAIAQGVFGGAAVDNKNAQEIEDSDDELSDGGSVGGFSDVIVISDDDEEDADSKPGMPDQDPYSSINMKKDRKEKVIESIQEPKTISIEGREVPGQG